MPRRAFTLLELTLAMLLAAFIMATALGLFGLMSTNDRALSGRFNDMANMARAHAVLREAMQALVAATPEPTTQTPGGRAQALPEEGAQPEGETDGASTQGASSDARSSRDSRSSRSSASSRSRSTRGSDRPSSSRASKEDGEAREGAARDGEGEGEGAGETGGANGRKREELPKPPHIWLGPTDVSRPGSAAESVPWTLELVLAQPPFKFLPRVDAPIRASFEKVAYGDGWALIWQPISPPGEPVIVMDGLAEVFMAVLTKDGAWTDYYEGREFKEFPRAIRVVLMSQSGATSDWLFEPGVTLGIVEGEE